jgi:hypothetical protein
MAVGLNPSDPSKQLYKESVLTFDVSFVSKIKVESKYKKGVNLN